MVEAMAPRATAVGEAVVAQGADLRGFFVIERGKFVFLAGGEPVAQVHDMGHFGELALLYDCASEHTVVSAGAGLLWALDRAVYRRILHRREQEHRLRIAALIVTTPTRRQLSSTRLVAIAKVPPSPSPPPARASFRFLSPSPPPLSNTSCARK
jgi:cAMP-dependent protein kinase regulator